ncbi:hypothetical protein TNIN_457501 [Trichonephila inaurata madagascariensis]|uniref:Uncharacterized protein n=1 Tax=Trichonephila inaurata madagascariensis TaxID=2747483 RepID=A0A8X6Y1S2_9ARAC|nr:hypothetical protein TNIN_457501 [Trichonephila inaurata madagascariensis]
MGVVSIRFFFFSYWDILLLPPLIVLLERLQKNNNIHCGKQSGDWDPEAKGLHTQEDTKLQETRKHSISVDLLIQKMIQDELHRIEQHITTKQEVR